MTKPNPAPAWIATTLLAIVLLTNNAHPLVWIATPAWGVVIGAQTARAMIWKINTTNQKGQQR